MDDATDAKLSEAFWAHEYERMEAMWAKEKLFRMILCNESEENLTQFVTSLPSTPSMVRMLRAAGAVLMKHGKQSTTGAERQEGTEDGM